MNKSELKKKAKKLWYFIWEDDSLLSWVVNIALAFLLIKFIVYPGLGLLFGTNFPVVAVVSGSMEHDGSFDQWWEDRGDFYENLSIDKDEFREFPFRNGFNTGDIMVLFGTKPEKIRAGNVIVFRTSTRPDPIIHRVVKVWEDDMSGEPLFQTKGDHNSGLNLEVNEGRITSDRYIGRAVLRIPYLGWIKIGAVKFINMMRELLDLR